MVKKTAIYRFFETGLLAKIRKYLIFYSLSFIFLWIIFFFALPYIFPYLLFPYYHVLKGQPLVFTSLEEALFVLLRISFYLALMIVLPFLCVHLWKVISSEFYEPEKLFLRKIFLVSFLLVLLGILVGYFLFIPFLIKIFLFFGNNFEANLKVSYFVFFVLRVLLFSVFIFQIPLIFALFIKEGMIGEEFYKRRKLHILGFFYVISVFVSPTDFFGQILLTFIFYLFFRLSFLLAKFL